MKLTKKFTVDTPYNTYGYANGKAARNELVCYLRISGVGYYDQSAHSKDNINNMGEDIEEYLSYDIESIITKDSKGNEVALNMSLWNMKDIFSDGLREVVEKSTQAHLEYVFEGEINPTDDNTPCTFDEARKDYEAGAMHHMRRD